MTGKQGIGWASGVALFLGLAALAAAWTVHVRSRAQASEAVAQIQALREEVARLEEQRDDAERLAAERLETTKRLEAAGRLTAASAAAREAEADAEAEKAHQPRSSASGHDWAIEEVGGNSYRLSREDVTYALDNLSALSRSARLVPSFADGRPNGFRVYAIREHSFLDLMGLEDGDTITKVNEFDLGDPEQALQVYSYLREDDSFNLEVVRRGRAVSLEYTVE